MAIKTFRQRYSELKEVELKIKELLKQKAKEAPLRQVYTQRIIDQAESKQMWLIEELSSFGRGHIVEVTGQIDVPTKKGGITIVSRKSFSMLLVNVELEEAKEYFEKIVKTKYSNLVLETISFKLLQTGILKINHVKL